MLSLIVKRIKHGYRIKLAHVNLTYMILFEDKQMKQLTIKDFSNAYEFKQAKKQAIKQCNALKIERKNKRIFIK